MRLISVEHCHRAVIGAYNCILFTLPLTGLLLRRYDV